MIETVVLVIAGLGFVITAIAVAGRFASVPRPEHGAEEVEALALFCDTIGADWQAHSELVTYFVRQGAALDDAAVAVFGGIVASRRTCAAHQVDGAARIPCRLFVAHAGPHRSPEARRDLAWVQPAQGGTEISIWLALDLEPDLEALFRHGRPKGWGRGRPAELDPRRDRRKRAGPTRPAGAEWRSPEMRREAKRNPGDR